MADNTTLPGTGEQIATDDVSGIKYQRVKIAVGGDGSAADNDATHPIFVSQTNAATGGATEATLATRASETTLGTRASESTLATRASESTLGTRASEATLANLLTAASAAQPAGENHIGEVGGNSAVVGGNFNRPGDTTQYASGDLIANSTTAGSVVPITCAVARKNQGTGAVVGARLHKSNNSLTNAQFRVHLYKNSPTSLVGDNGALAAQINGIASVAIGYIDITMDEQFSDGAKGYSGNIGSKVFDCAAGSQNIYALIEARAAYTPANAETFTLALECLRD